MNFDMINKLAVENNVQLIRFLFCDTSGIIRGKVCHISDLKARVESGIGLVKGTMAMTIMDELLAETGYGAVGEVRLVPDLQTFRIIPYVSNSALLLCNMFELDKKPWSLCPRNILNRQIEKASELGIRFEAAFEPEFILGKLDNNEFKPIDTSNCFATDGMNKASEFIHKFIELLQQQGLDVLQYYPELGHGQHEVSVKHRPAMQAADNQIIYRETLRGVSNQMGILASLAPKPGIDMPGNGCHIHLSAWDIEANTNLFWSNSGLSTVGKFFVGGLLKHLPGIVGITCPTVNSYRRLKPKSWSSAFTCWGYENREAAIRVPSLYWDRELETANIEIKCVDSSTNPYLALAVLIACGIDGVRKQINPPEPVQVDPSSVGVTEASEKQINRLPQSLREASKKILMDQIIMDTLGEEFAKVYLKLKTSEENYFSKHGPEEEIKAHFLRF